MKALRILASLAALAAALPAAADFQSARIAEDNLMPQYPGALTLAGITKGHAVIVVSVDAEGKVQDSLVLAYTQPQLARASLEAVREWRFIPARLDGMAVPVRTEVRFDFTLEGAVITTNAVNHFFFDSFENAGDNVTVYQPARVDLLDRTPVRIQGDAPKYDIAALKEGVRGMVKVHFYINEQGNVRLPAVVWGEHPYLEEKAVAAVRNWKFEPPTSRGRPVLVAATQEFDFGGTR